MKKITGILAALMAMVMLLTSCGKGETTVEKEFVPALDTTKEITLHFGSFFGNFEALVEVQNEFNKYYPNVDLDIQSVGRSDMPDFFKNNPDLDIFMTSNERGYPVENCVDLLEAGVDVSAADKTVIEGNKHNGKLYTLPMSLTLKGMVVNKTLLEKEGLSVPETWKDLLTVLEALKQKGYTPIQGPDSAVALLCYNMGMAMIADDAALLKAVQSGDAAGASALNEVFERLETLADKGYISADVNAGYPNDNYDGAILKFFEGDVPFWICDTEKVSGMKKRESKSESFKANPFEYEFIYAPIGDKGAYKYTAPWYGFAVNKDSTQVDYAVEFLRFAARQDQLNTLASVKGVPSIAKVTTDTRYANLAGAKTEVAVVSNGTVPDYYGVCLTNAAGKLLTGEFSGAEAATQAFVAACIDSGAEK